MLLTLPTQSLNGKRERRTQTLIFSPTGFTIAFVCVHAPPLSLHLPKGMFSNFAPLLESVTDCFIVCVFILLLVWDDLDPAGVKAA